MAPRRTRSSKPKQVTPPQANLTPIHHQINNDPPPPIPAIGNLPNSNEIIPPAGGLALTRPAPLNLFPSAFQEGHQSTSSALGPSRRPPATPFNFQTHPIDITPTSHSSTRFRFTDAPAPSTRIQAPSHKRARLDDIDEYRNSSGTSNHRGVRFQSPVTQSEDHHVFDSHPVSELDPVSEAQTASEADSGLDEAQPPTVDMSSDSEWSPDQPFQTPVQLVSELERIRDHLGDLRESLNSQTHDLRQIEACVTRLLKIYKHVPGVQ